MRYWMFGTAQGWLNCVDSSDGRRRNGRGNKESCILNALARSPAGYNFLYLYEGKTLVQVCDMTQFFMEFARQHNVNPGELPDLTMHQVLANKRQSRASLSPEIEKDVLAYFKEKQREQSNGNRPKRRRRRH